MTLRRKMGLCERTGIAGENFGELEKYGQYGNSEGQNYLRKHGIDSFYAEGFLKYLISKKKKKKKGVTQNMLGK